MKKMSAKPSPRAGHKPPQGKILIKLLIIIGIVGAIAAFGLIRKGRAEKIVYRTEAVVKGDVESVVETSGIINAFNTVDVGSQVSGKIVKLYADYNSPVKAGQVVAEIDQEPLLTRIAANEASYASSLASVAKAKVTLTTAQRKNERTLDLFAKNLVSLQDKESAEVDFATAKLALRIAEKSVVQAKSDLDISKTNLAYAIIRSPIDGTVIERKVSLGQTVAAGFQAPVLFTVATDLRKMQVDCNVDEADVGRLREGQAIRFTVAAFPEDQFTGRLSQVRYSATTTSNVVTYSAIADVENPDVKLRPGMTAVVTIVTAEARGVDVVSNMAFKFTPTAVSKDAAAEFAGLKQKAAGKGDAIVWVQDAASGKLMPRLIRTGIAGKLYSQVLTAAGLGAGEKIVTGMGAASTFANSMFGGPPPMIMMATPPPPPPPGR